MAFTHICLSSLSLFVFLSFNGCIFLSDVLVCLLGFRCSKDMNVWISPNLY